MQAFIDFWYTSKDGLNLYARDYSHPKPKATVICIPGLTRNARDFEPVCEKLQSDYRVLAVDLRGRGRSDYDPDPKNYHPGTYVEDIQLLTQQLQGQDIVLLGTSLGGLVSMIVTALVPSQIQALIVNDIGPDINPDGLSRIRAYITNTVTPKSWPEAVDITRDKFAPEYPNFTQQQWEALARCLYIEDQGGLRLDYDSGISVLFEDSQPDAIPPDLWPMFDSLAEIPMMVVHGELSDILLSETVDKMYQRHSGLKRIDVAEVGHAPLLTEPGVFEAIQDFLKAL